MLEFAKSLVPKLVEISYAVLNPGTSSGGSLPSTSGSSGTSGLVGGSSGGSGSITGGSVGSFPGLKPISGTTGFAQMATRVVNVILAVAGLIAVIYLIYGGILYITAGGDAEKAGKGRTAVVNAIIGIVIILIALAIVNWVVSIVNKGTSGF